MSQRLDRPKFDAVVVFDMPSARIEWLDPRGEVEQMGRVRNVLHFTISNLLPSDRQNGGSLYARNLIERLASDESMKLHVLNVINMDLREDTKVFLDGLGAESLFQPMFSDYPFPKDCKLSSSMSFMIMALLRFDYELEAYRQTHILPAIQWAIVHWNIDQLIVDSTIAALFIGDIGAIKASKAVVTINREAELYAIALRYAGFPRGRLISKLSLARFQRREQAIYKAFDQVVAIGKPDLPDLKAPYKASVITSYLPTQAERWCYKGSKIVFFVGNIAYMPNRRAIEFISRQLAPMLLSRHPTVKIKIVGAEAEQVDRAWHLPNITFLGTATDDIVKKLFLLESLLIVPVDNTFGMKFKVAEAISYGTPFLAAPQTMLGFPYLADLSSPSMNDPSAWASAIADLLFSKDGVCLTGRSAKVKRSHDNFVSTQKDIWSHAFWRLSRSLGSANPR